MFARSLQELGDVERLPGAERLALLELSQRDRYGHGEMQCWRRLCGASYAVPFSRLLCAVLTCGGLSL